MKSLILSTHATWSGGREEGGSKSPEVGGCVKVWDSKIDTMRQDNQVPDDREQEPGDVEGGTKTEEGPRPGKIDH